MVDGWVSAARAGRGVVRMDGRVAAVVRRVAVLVRRDLRLIEESDSWLLLLLVIERTALFCCVLILGEKEFTSVERRNETSVAIVAVFMVFV